MRSILTAAVAPVLIAIQASAADVARIDVPAGDLAAALDLLQRQSDIELIYEIDQLKNLRTRGVTGDLSPQEALSRLLEGTSLTLETDASGAMLITAPHPKGPLTPGARGDRKQTHSATSPAAAEWEASRVVLAQAVEPRQGMAEGQSTESGQPANSPPGTPRYLDEVIVTAQKRAQPSEDLGLSISVLGGESVDRQRVRGIEEISQAVPSLDVFRGNGSNNPTITLRGIGTTNPWVNNSPSVAAHVDGIYMPMSAYLTFPVFDLERIEVLKGPQIGLYGRNSTAGAVNFVTARPTSTGTGYLDVSYGRYDAWSVGAAASGPLGESVWGRIAAVTRQGGGYMYRFGTAATTAGFTPVPGTIPPVALVEAERGYGDQDINAFRGSLEFTGTETFDAFLSAHYSIDQSELVGSTNTNGDRLRRFLPPNDDAYVDYDDFAPFTDSTQFGGALEMNWYAGDIKITSLTGFESIDRRYGIGDFVPTRVAEANFDEEIESFAQELRVESGSVDEMRWLFGASYSKDRIDYFRSLVAYDFLRGALGTAYRETDEAKSAFSQVEWRLAPQWLLTGSLRYTDEDKAYDGGSFDINPFGTSRIGLAFPRVVPNGLFGSPRYSDSDLSGRLGLNYEPHDRLLLYASAGRGFKSGGFDGSGITQPSSFTPFDAETVFAYETGLKLRAPSKRFFMASSIFFYDYSDKQELALVDLGAGVNEAIIQNAASSEIYGIDVEWNWLIGEALTLSANATWLDSEITGWNSVDPVQVAARLGNDLPGTPKFMLTAAADWKRRLASGVTLNATLWGNYSDSAFRDIENSAALVSDSYGLVNARLDFVDDSGWSVYLFGKNLLNREYVTSVRILVGMLGEYHGSPRTWGIGIRYQPKR